MKQIKLNENHKIDRCPTCCGVVSRDLRDGVIISTTVRGGNQRQAGVYCPVCGHALRKKACGMVCKNWRCPIYWKLGRGFVWNDNSNK